MEKIIYFDECALVLFLVLFITTLIRKITQGKLNRYFLELLLVSVVVTICDISCIYLDQCSSQSLGLRTIMHTSYLLLHSLTAPYYFVYVVALTDTWHKLGKRHEMLGLLCIPTFSVIAAMIVNFYHPIIFYFDAMNVYQRGPYFMLLYISSGIYMICGIVYICCYRKLLGTEKFLSVLVMYPLLIGAIVVQFFYPNYPVEMFANAIGLLCISVVVQKPEENLEPITRLGNANAYKSDMKKAFITEKSIDIILLHVVNYKALCDMLGYDSVNGIVRKMSGRLLDQSKRLSVKAEHYYMDSGNFAVVLEQKGRQKTDLYAQQIHKEFQSNLHTKHMDVSVSVNVCVVHCPKDIEDAQSLLFFGNEFQNRGYSDQVWYAEELLKQEQFDVRKNMDRIIERALEHHYFEVYYQPIYSVEEKRFNSAEALLRLKDAQYGFISPELFIPAAEKNGTIHKIGNFVLEEVCRFISSDTFQTLNIDYIEVNLSVAQCMKTDLAEEVLHILASYHVTPDKINLEITETAASYSQSVFMKNLEELNQAGIKFSLDDFGTGYSNMARVAQLPLHIIKLDKSFADSESDPRMKIIIQNMVRMIKDMNMKIVVEGIETEHLLTTFSDMHCDYIQGYYYSKPIPQAEFVSFIRASGDV